MAKKRITKKERLALAATTLIPIILTTFMMDYFLNNWHPLHLPQWVIFFAISFIIYIPVFMIINHLFLKKLQSKK